MQLARDGAELHVGAGLDIVDRLEAVVGGYDLGPGKRLTEVPGLHKLLCAERLAVIATSHLGRAVFLVRAVLFDKSVSNNWTLSWHQDRTITVKDRRDVHGFGPWTMKQGQLHVAPPIDVIEQMVTLRIHFDPVCEDNAPLLIALGTHKHGSIGEQDIPERLTRARIASCPAARGDVWAYATPILHRSAPSKSMSRRRVLQVDYASQALPDGLEWAGV